MNGTRNIARAYDLYAILATIMVISLACAPVRAEPVLIHDRMAYGEHPEFKWHATLVGWLSYMDGYAAGLPYSEFHSAVISGIRFDETADTLIVIARMDRNGLSKFCIGYTAVPPDFSDYNIGNIAYGVFIDSTGALSPSWAAGNEGYWSSTLPEGIYDLRITIDRTVPEITFDFDAAPAFDSPLSTFGLPLLSLSAEIAPYDILHIQINLYNEHSAVYDVWSIKGTPSYLYILQPRDMVAIEGDTVEFRTSAEYDGDKELQWYFEDPRFERAGDTLRWMTRDGDGGLYATTLSVTDGCLLDSMTVRYAVTQIYDPSLCHDRMNGLPASPYGWVLINEAFWYTSLDGYLRGADIVSWTSAAVATREEPLDVIRSWVFRILAGGGREYALGLTETPPARHNGRHGNLSLGVLIEGDGKVSPAWYSANNQFKETVLEEGLYDIRMTWDPAIDEARFEAVPVAAWPDSLSSFSRAVWTTWADGNLDAPVWIQASVIGGAPRVYDIWSYVPRDGPSIVTEYNAKALPGWIELAWTVACTSTEGEFVVIRCPGAIGGCRELVRIPLMEGMTGYGYHDTDVAPGSEHDYRVYLDRGLGMEPLFEEIGIEVPVAPARLFQNYPNPFNPGTRIRWYQPCSSRVRITIFDVAGHPVRLLVDDIFEAGFNSTVWDGAREGGDAASSGVYFCRIEAGPFSSSRKMVLLR